MKNDITNNKTIKTEMQNNVNKFVIRGVVVSKYETSSALLVNVKTSPYENAIDYPYIVFYDKALADRFSKAVEVGERATIEGHVNTSKKYPQGTLIATGFRKELSRLQAAFENKEYIGDANQVMISGVVFKEPYVKPRLTLLNIKTTTEEGSIVFFPVTCFDRYAQIASRKRMGERIKVFCFVKTQDKKELTQNGLEGKHSPQTFVMRGIENDDSVVPAENTL